MLRRTCKHEKYMSSQVPWESKRTYAILKGKPSSPPSISVLMPGRFLKESCVAWEDKITQ